MEKQNKIYLKRTFVKSVNFEYKKDSTEDELDTLVNIKKEPIFKEGIDNEYIILFDGSFENEIFDLKIEFLAIFGTSEKIDADFKKSTFVKSSSPAIAFPYLRSFISTLTLNAGLPPLILPAYNFTRENEQIDE
ncbi:protein-export chaperone SecB [Capnocytophaga leadbetteri]|uniref:protein-export chaperone SecB n=1 Tax=Capnocytophaga leadbetteri TaxID=327575 RepID=UPI0028EB77AC|nr:protein-export chaperone SecB [Capnocytophaga leadbetteri]